VSANIVGYQTVSLSNQQTLSGVAFQAVGGGLTSIQDIVVDGVAPEGTTRIWWWNKASATYSEAFWVELFDADGIALGVNGWGDGEEWIAVEKAFAAGEGFWIKAAVDGATVTVKGELAVSTGDQQYLGIGLQAQQQALLTNPMPVSSTDLQSIVADGADPEGTTRIWWWNGASATYSEAFWVELYDASGALGVNGWGDGEEWIAIGKTFAAGEGFWVKTPSAGAQVLFENPLY
jgi:hypothetical protein